MKIPKHKKRQIRSVMEADCDKLVLVRSGTVDALEGTERFAASYRDDVRHPALTLALEHLRIRNTEWSLFVYVFFDNVLKPYVYEARHLKEVSFRDLDNEVTTVAETMAITVGMTNVRKIAYAARAGSHDASKWHTDAIGYFSKQGILTL